MNGHEFEQTPQAPGIGEAVTETIVFSLRFKALFPDADQELDSLVTNLESIEDLSISEQELASEVLTECAPIVTKSAKQRLITHATMLRAGKVLITPKENKIPEWEMFHPNQKDGLTALQQTSKEQLDETVSLDLHTRNESAGTKTQLEELFVETVDQLVSEISRLIPDPHEPAALSRKASLFAKVLSKDVDFTPHYCEGVLPKDQTVYTRVSKQVRKLNELLISLKNNPAAAIVANYARKMNDELVKLGAELVDSQLTAGNNQMFELVRPTQKSKDYKPTPKNQVKEVSTLQAPTTEESPPHPEEISRDDIDVFEIPDLRINLPWEENAQPKSLTSRVYKSGDKQVLLIDSMEGRLKEISETSRSKSRLSNLGENQYDAMSEKVVSMLLDGIMPFHKNSGLNTLKLQDDSPYKAVAIWYTFDKSPNAPRVYFTLKNASEITPPEDLIKNDIDPTTFALIIIAETDKTNQLTTLGDLTGMSRKKLRKYGVGSI